VPEETFSFDVRKAAGDPDNTDFLDDFQGMPADASWNVFFGESCRNIPRAGSGQRLFTLASPPPGRAQRRDPKGQRSEQANGRESGCLHGFSQETVCRYLCR